MAIEQNVIDEMVKQSPLNFDKATAIAEKFGLKPRSIVASAIRNKIAYENKPRVSKTGNPVVSKADLVSAIADTFCVSVDSLAGLEKANKSALEVLASAPVEVIDESETDD